MSLRLSRTCFVHIPRTGGLWLGEVVRVLGLRCQVFKGDIDSHLEWSQLPDNWKALTAFSFVRHPLAWLKSRWSHALEINACPDYRHYGVHRLFDECVRPTLTDTVRVILDRCPGLVTHTYTRMLDGVSYLARTEDLPEAAWQILYHLEGVSEQSRSQVLSIPPINSTTTLLHWRDKICTLPDSLVQAFLDSEQQAISWWDRAVGSYQQPVPIIINQGVNHANHS